MKTNKDNYLHLAAHLITSGVSASETSILKSFGLNLPIGPICFDACVALLANGTLLVQHFTSDAISALRTSIFLHQTFSNNEKQALIALLPDASLTEIQLGEEALINADVAEIIYTRLSEMTTLKRMELLKHLLGFEQALEQFKHHEPAGLALFMAVKGFLRLGQTASAKKAYDVLLSDTFAHDTYKQHAQQLLQ